MAPLVEAGEIRQMSMLMVSAVVNGPAHAIARRWLAGHVSAPLHSYLDELTDAACAALSGTPVSARRRPAPPSYRGRIQMELLAEDGQIVANGETTAELTPARLVTVA